MTKKQFQQELKEKVKAGVKPSDLKKLKRSKSADDLPLLTPNPNPPLKKSHSQLEIPLPQQPNKEQQIKQLKQDLLFTQSTAQSYLTSLQAAQAQITQLQEQVKVKSVTNQPTQTSGADDKVKIKELEDKVLELRVEKIKEFGEYQEKKQALAGELELNVTTGLKEIQKLENQLITTNKKKLELQSQLAQSHQKNANLELKLIQELTTEPSFNYWPWLALVGVVLTLWLLKN